MNFDKILGIDAQPTKEDLLKIREMMEEELKEVTEEYHHAVQMFDLAEDEYVEVAGDFVTAAKIKLDATIKKIKIMDESLSYLDMAKFDKNVR